MGLDRTDPLEYVLCLSQQDLAWVEWPERSVLGRLARGAWSQEVEVAAIPAA
jgi:hypothetical protein